MMEFYYVATVGGDIFTSSPSLERVFEELDRFNRMYPKYFKENKVQILTYEKRGEIIEWQSKKH